MILVTEYAALTNKEAMLLLTAQGSAYIVPQPFVKIKKHLWET